MISETPPAEAESESSAAPSAALRLADAQGLYAATTMLMAEGQEKGFHFFALHLRVALMELDTQMGGALAPPVPLQPLSSLPPARRRTPRVSAQMRSLIKGG